MKSHTFAGKGLKYGEVNGVDQFISDMQPQLGRLRDFTTRTFTRNGQRYMEINATGEVDMLKRTTKAWGANKSLVTATSLYGLQARATKPSRPSARTNAKTCT